MKKYLFPIIAAVLMALAILLGLSQRQDNPENQKSLHQQNTNARSSIKNPSDSPKKDESQASFLAVGDIMLSRNVAGKIQKAGDPLLPFKNTSDLLASTDFNFGNLESPLSGNNSFNPSGSLIFNAPPAYAVGLQKYNFQILNLANNHAFDQGKGGLDYTGKFLDDKNIIHIGTGSNLEGAWQGKVITAKGIRIGFIGASYSSLNDGGKAKNNYVARIEDTARLQAAISDLKSKSDFVVVTMHAGTEYTRTPNASQTAFAHAAINAGADMVIGAHPHWIQTTEAYKGKYIFYSLGNFIFDQEWSQETKEGLTLKVTLASGNENTRAKLKHIELVPVILENYSTPRAANEQEAKNILNKIGVTENIITP
jgi:poly-gamma-glutamate synthesis protein (capsule biosynthesis protein)